MILNGHELYLANERARLASRQETLNEGGSRLSAAEMLFMAADLWP